jgi:putative membrane protein
MQGSLLYKTILSLHLISVISWMAGILYLFRLFVYHTEETEALVKQRFHVMESRLYKIITLPAMAASLVFGFTLAILHPPHFAATWFSIKLAFVFALVACTLFAGGQISLISEGKSKVSSREFRFLNELPTLLMIGIIFLAVFKPGAAQ